MKRLLLVAMLIAGTISMTGCSSGPFRSMFRGSPCGSSNQTSCNSATDYGYSNSGCPTCGNTAHSIDYYDNTTITAPPIGTIPAPGPGAGQ